MQTTINGAVMNYRLHILLVLLVWQAKNTGLKSGMVQTTHSPIGKQNIVGKKLIRQPPCCMSNWVKTRRRRPKVNRFPGSNPESEVNYSRYERESILASSRVGGLLGWPAEVILSIRIWTNDLMKHFWLVLWWVIPSGGHFRAYFLNLKSTYAETKTNCGYYCKGWPLSEVISSVKTPIGIIG